MFILINSSRISLIVLLGLLTINYAAYSQVDSNQEVNQRKLMELNAKVQQEGERGNHHLIEQYMDSMVGLMLVMEIPSPIITERAHLRIKYSSSVGRLDSARNAAISWLNKNPNDMVVQEILGNITLQMDRPKEARVYFENVYKSNPQNPGKLFRYLNVLNLLDDRDQALSLCEIIVDHHSKDSILMLQAINSYIQYNQADKAIKLIDQLQTIVSPDDPSILYARAKALQELGEFEKAINALLKIPETYKNWQDAKQLTGLCYSKLRQFDKAAAVFVEILSTYPYDAKTMSLLEQALARQRKIKGFKQVQKIRQKIEKIYLPDIEASYLWRKGDVVEHARLRSLSLNLIGKFRDSESLFLKACQIVPDSTSAQNNLAKFYITTHQACRAEKILCDLMPKVSTAEKSQVCLDLAQSYLRQGKINDAIELLEAHSADNSLKQSLQSMIGSSYLEIIGDATQAISYLKSIKTESTEIRATLARAFMEIGDILQAGKYFESLPQDYKHIKTTLSRIEYLARLDQKDQAQLLFKQTLEDHPDLPAMLTVAARSALAKVNHSENSGDLAQSASIIKQALKKIQQKVMQTHRLIWPESIPVLLELSDIYAGIGELEIALQYAQLASEADQNRIDINQKIIELMTAPEYVFQRLSQIRIVKSYKNNQRNYDKEIKETLAHLELSPQE